MDGWMEERKERREEEENRPTEGGVEEAESLGWKHPRFGGGCGGRGELRRGRGGKKKCLRRFFGDEGDEEEDEAASAAGDEEIGGNPPQQRRRGGEMEGASERARAGISACCGRAIVSGRECVARPPACPPAHPAAPRPPSAAVAAELRSEKEPQECFWKQ